MTPRARSLRTQLLAAIVVVVLVAAAISLVVGAVLTRRAVDRSVLQDVSQQADLLAERERVALLPLGHLQVAATVPRAPGRARRRRAARPAVEVPPGRRRRAGPNGTISVDGKDWFYAARPVAGKALVLLRPRVVGAATWRPYLEGLLIAAGDRRRARGGDLVSARAPDRPARCDASPRRRERLAAGVAPGAVPAEGAAELVSLAESFNHMAIELEHARDAERAFLLSVSHELKTPLTAVLGYAEGLGTATIDADAAAATIAKEGRASRPPRAGHARSRADEQARVQRAQRAGRSRARSRPSAARRHEAQAAPSGSSSCSTPTDDAQAHGDADRSCRRSRTSSRTRCASPPAGGTVRIVARTGLARSRGRRPGPAAGRDPARVRALLPPLALRRQPAGRHGARPRDRRRARARDGRRRRRAEPAGPHALLDPAAARARPPVVRSQLLQRQPRVGLIDQRRDRASRRRRRFRSPPRAARRARRSCARSPRRVSPSARPRAAASARGDRACERDALALARRQPRHALVDELAEADRRASASTAASRSAPRSSSTSSTFSRALRNGMRCASCATSAISLAAHPLVRRAAEHDDLSRVGRLEAREQVEQRRLARAGTARHRREARRAEARVDPVEHAARP